MKERNYKLFIMMLVFGMAVLLPSCRKNELNFKPMYRQPIYDVAEEPGRKYAKNVKGYWMSYSDTREDFGTIYIGKLKDLTRTRNLDLDMDVYYPKEPISQCRRPLLLLIHGGAFYNGDKRDLGYPEMGHYFAERGYVVASINYRLGFLPMAPDVDRAGYRALQDAHAAVCYLLNNADEFGIDTTKIFAAGTSAGAITALNLAFMGEEHRPESTRKDGVKGWASSATKKIVHWINRGLHWLNPDWDIDGEALCKNLGLNTDLGPITTVSGPDDRPFKINAVVNMWGAMHDLTMLEKSPQTGILSFHGDDDRILPYEYGYPFDEMLEPYVDDVIESLPDVFWGLAGWMRNWITSGQPINELAFNPMYGSKTIHDKAYVMGRHCELQTMRDGGHSLHLTEDRTELSDYFYDIILPNMNRFLCEELVGGEIVQIVKSDNDDLWFEAVGTGNVSEMHWKVEGGKIVKKHGKNKVKVKFDDEASHWAVTVCGKYKNGVEFAETIE